MCVAVLFACVSVYHMCALCPQTSEKGIGFLGNWRDRQLGGSQWILDIETWTSARVASALTAEHLSSSYEGLFLIVHLCSSTQPTVDDGSMLGQVGLCCITKVAEGKTGSKSGLLHGLCFNSCIQISVLSSCLGFPQ